MLVVCNSDEQVIKTNQTNILIRSLTIEKQKNESSPKDLKINGSALNTNGKRCGLLMSVGFFIVLLSRYL